MEILSEEGRRALKLAATETDPNSLAAGERLRREFPPELAAAALTQVTLRRRARGKLPNADRMFFTPDGLEQATRWVVARWRATQFADAGVREIWDLGCGLGIDAMACAAANLRVHAVEADPMTAAFARENLALTGGGQVTVGLAEEVTVPESVGVFLDPARRTARGRTWDVAEFSPPWQLVERYLTGPWATIVKLGPGLPKPLIPLGISASWLSVGGAVVEAMLTNLRPAGPRAVVFRPGRPEPHILEAGAEPLPVKAPGAFLHEPDNAVIRAGLVAEAAGDAWLLAPGIAYLSSDAPLASPFATDYRVLETLDFDVAVLRRWVKTRGIGALEIKCRALDVDPARLRRQLKPKGPGAATLILARTVEVARVFVVERLKR